MTINVAWDQDDNKIIYMSIHGIWTWDDYYKSQTKLYEMLDASEHDVVDIILNLQNTNLFPKNVMSRMERQTKTRHPKTGVMAVVGVGAFAKVLFNLMERIAPDRMSRVKLVDTLENARKLIQQHRAETIHSRA